uniref:Ribosomal RNA processing protein 1 homolog n=1 Tax=Panagrellus redivivus TaxID=6233 RepID=A0A7E4VBP3_PANRE
MYPNLDQQEIVFVHKLSSGEPRARSRALKKLHSFLKESSESQSLNSETYTNLSKGLHYAMWMQDKPLLQEELAENIASLIDDFETTSEAASFVSCFIVSLSKEWHLVDRWRMDKFLMMLRVFIRKVFVTMATAEWSPEVVEPLMEALTETLISPTSRVVDSLKTHFASVYWDELGQCENVTEDVAHTFLDRYLAVLAENRTSDLYFRSICDEVFESLVRTVSRELEDGEEDEEYDEMTRVLRLDNPIPLDLDKVRKTLFEIGAKPTVNSRRRKRLYTLSKKFGAIIKGKNPVARPVEPPKGSGVDKGMVINAADKLKSIEARLKKDRQKFKTEMKVIKKQKKAEELAHIEKIMAIAKKKASSRKSANKFKPGAIKRKTGHHRTPTVPKKSKSN